MQKINQTTTPPAELPPRQKLDDLHLRFVCLANNLAAVHTAMEHGPNMAGSYLNGLFACENYLNVLCDELGGIVDEFFEQEKHCKTIS